MSWVTLSIIAPLIWSVSNIIDKVALDRWIRHPIVNVFANNVIGVVLSIILLAIGFVEQTSSSVWLLNVVAGVLYIVAISCYFKAAQQEEISRVVPLWYLTPLAVGLLSILLLKERLGTEGYLGVLLLVVGAILVATHSLRQIRINGAFWLMIVAVAVMAFNTVIVDYTLDQTDVWTVLYQTRWGALLAQLPLIGLTVKEVRWVSNTHGTRPLLLVTVSESLTQVGNILITFALAVGVATFVNALASVHPLFVLLETVLLSLFWPTILHEKLTSITVIQKFVGILALVWGALLITS